MAEFFGFVFNRIFKIDLFFQLRHNKNNVQKRSKHMKTITAKKLNELINKNEVLIIDVREKFEHTHEKIAKSLLLPLDKIEADLIPPTDKMIVLYCQAGKRSLQACEKILKKNDKLNIYSLEGGINAWKNAGLHIEQNTCSVLPMNRQIQCIAGCLVLSGTILGYIVDEKYYLIASFVGAGLTFAGLTGWCGMALILAKMPWNR